MPYVFTCVSQYDGSTINLTLISFYWNVKFMSENPPPAKTVHSKTAGPPIQPTADVWPQFKLCVN